MIELKDVSFSYQGRKAVENITFSIQKGEKVVILGINGSGKSTILKIINALLFPQEGTYRYRGEIITPKKMKDREFVRKFRKEVVLLFQNPDTMIFNPTVFDEIAFGLRQLGEKDIKEKVHYWADKLGIFHLLDRSPFELSGGEKQKVCLAALLSLEPEVLLLDEPTANLDPRSTGWLIDFLYQLDITVVTTTHNLGIALELGERGLVLSENHRLIYDGNLSEFLKDREKLLEANLIHIHRHRHDDMEHRHYHIHDDFS
ncbi:energy-coupling factor ABC transporter ATP-binding protein [Persephonella sp.]